MAPKKEPNKKVPVLIKEKEKEKITEVEDEELTDSSADANTNTTTTTTGTTETISEQNQPEIEDEERTKCHNMFLTFLGQPGINMCLSLMNFVKQESHGTSVQILRLNEETKNLRFYTRSNTILPNHQDMSLENCQLFSNVVKNSQPELLSKKNSNDKYHFRTTITQISQLFIEVPGSILVIPVCLLSRKCIGIVCISYYSSGICNSNNVPKSLADLKFPIEKLCLCINILVPFVMKAQEAEDSATLVEAQSNIFKAVNHTEVECIGDRAQMLMEIASQLKTLIPCQSLAIFLVDNEGNKLIPHCIPEFWPKISKKTCPNSKTHDAGIASFDFADSQELFWVVKNNKVLRVNCVKDCKQYGIRVRRKEIHTQAGCVARNFMCVPINDQSDKLPLIVEMIDKEDSFSTQDEYKATMYAKYASPLLTSSAILAHRGKMKKRGAVFDEVVRNVVPILDEEIHQLKATNCSFSDEFKTFSYSMKKLPPIETSAAVLAIFTELGLLSRWNMHRTSVVRFILCVQQSYRDVPYHNWMHAASVTHFAYILVSTLKLVERQYLSDLEVLAFIVSCVCHDVDHRGYNNHFQLCTQSFLYTLYKEDDSIMERHHLSVALAILSREDCNIVEYLSEKEYKDFIRLLSWNILSTDIGKHMRCRDEFFETIRSLDKTNAEHRMTLLSCCMTMCDLCDNTKNWDDNMPTVKNIFTEFFIQGDEEKKMGWKPAPMMDRKHAYIPDAEIKFLQYVCRPVYHALTGIFPPIQKCVDNIDHQIELWYLSTQVFDSHYLKKDSLDVLDLPGMKENALWKTYSPQLVTELRGRRYSNIAGASRTSLKTFRVTDTGQKKREFADDEDSDDKDMAPAPAPEPEPSEEQIKQDLCRWCCLK